MGKNGAYMKKIFNSRRELIRALKNSGLVVLGSIILAFGIAVFIVPFDLVTGGVSGLSIAIVAALDIEFITVDLCVTVLTWVLFFIGFIVLGKAFAIKTLISSIVYPIALSLFMRLTSPDVLDGFLCIAKDYNFEQPDYALPIISAVFGGVLVGVGCAITFRGGGSTGGLDILALIVAKYVKRAKSSVMVFVFDAAVVILGLFVMKNLITCLLGVTSAFICALVIDKVFIGESKAFIANIISEQHEQLREAIINKLDRTCTVIAAKGGYTEVERPMIMVSFTMPEYAALIALVNGIDPSAFVTIHRAHEIEGEGFTKYDVKPAPGERE